MTESQKAAAELDGGRMDFILLDLGAARIAIAKGKRKLAREIIDVAIKDLQTQSWMLNTVP